MISFKRRALLTSVTMCAAGLASMAARPSVRMADMGGKLDLETMIPRRFGDWVQDERQTASVVNPQGTGLVNRIYQQVLSRTYYNARNGHHVMLSIAYGEDQNHSNDLHLPDVCYSTGGFKITQESVGDLGTRHGKIRVKRLVTNRMERHEPLTYWAIVGGQVVVGSVQTKLVALSFGLRGVIPDGLIFRVSTVSSDDAEAFADQERFVSEMFDAMPSSSRKRLANLE